MGILAWMVLGLVAGILSKLILPGDDPGGFFMTIVIGVVGALIGGFISTNLGYGSVTGVNGASIFIAIIGSLILLMAYRKLKKD